MAEVTAARIIIPVKTDAGKATTDITKLDKALVKTGKDLKTVSAGASKTASIFKGLATGAAVIAIAKVGAEMIKLASNAEETRNKFSVTFKDVASEASRASVELAESFGLASEESQRLLSNTGDLLTGFGLSGGEALNLSTDLNTLAADLASFTNIEGGTQRASEALTKALLGERESVKALGIVISEKAIKEELALRGQEKLTGNALLQAKAFATLKIATEQSKNAIGDFERSQDSFANVSKTVNAQLKDLGAEIGTILIPVFKEGLLAVRNFLAYFQRLAKARKVDALETKSGLKNQEFAIKQLKENIRLGKINIDNINERKNASGRLAIETADLAANQKKLDLILAENFVLQDKVNTATEDGTFQIKEYTKALAGKTEGEKKAALTSAQLKAIADERKRILKDTIAVLIEAGNIELARSEQDKQFAKEKKDLANSGLETEKTAALLHASHLEQRKQLEQDYANKSIEIEAARIATIVAGFTQIATAAGNLNNIFAMFAQASRNRTQQEINDLAAQQEATLAAAAASGATEEELTQLKIQQEEKLAAKQRELNKKAVQDQKKFGRVSIIIDTAIAVAKIWSQTGILGVVNQGLALAAGAAQLAVLESTPVPAQFGGSFVVPPGNEADSGLLAVNSGEQVDVTPVRDTGTGSGGGNEAMILQVDGQQMDAWLIDAMNRNLNNGKVQIQNAGTIKVA